MSGAILLSDGKTFCISQELACYVGLEEAILLQQVHYFVSLSTKEADGRRWSYNTYEDWHKLMPYLSVSTIKRKLKKLVELKLLVIGHYSTRIFSRTNWYSINYEALKAFVAQQRADRGEALVSVMPSQCETQTDSESEVIGSNCTEASVQNDPKALGQNDPNFLLTYMSKTYIASYSTGECEKAPPHPDKSVFRNVPEPIRDLAQKAIDYLNEKTGQHYVIRPLELKRISALYKLGYELKHFMKVIDKKVSEWIGKAKTRAWLTPMVLFSSKFAKYLSEQNNIFDENAFKSTGRTYESHQRRKTHPKAHYAVVDDRMSEAERLLYVEKKKAHALSANLRGDLSQWRYAG